MGHDELNRRSVRAPTHPLVGDTVLPVKGVMVVLMADVVFP